MLFQAKRHIWYSCPISMFRYICSLVYKIWVVDLASEAHFLQFNTPKSVDNAHRNYAISRLTLGLPQTSFVVCYMRTVELQISLRIREVWSGSYTVRWLVNGRGDYWVQFWLLQYYCYWWKYYCDTIDIAGHYCNTIAIVIANIWKQHRLTYECKFTQCKI